MLRHIAGAFGRFIRTPVSTGANILTLALGLAAFIVAWGVVSYWRSSDSQFARADRIQIMTQHAYLAGVADTGVQPAMPRVAAPYLKEDFPELEAVARLRNMGLISAETEQRTTMLRGSQADPELLDIFDFEFVAGDPRTALKQESGLLLTQAAAEKLFGAEPALGRTVLLNKTRQVVVTGVLGPIRQPSHMGDGAGHPVSFDYISVWRPDPPAPEMWLGNSVTTYALLPADGSLTNAAFNARLGPFVQRRVSETERSIATVEFGAIPLSQFQISSLNTSLFGKLAGKLSVDSILLGLGLLVLAIACLNYANLATAQALTRAKQIGMRKMMGASLGEILAQSWVESALLALLALALAGLGVWLASPVIAAQLGIDIAGALARQPMLAPMLLGLVAAVSIAAGAYPAFVAARFRPAEALRAGKSRAGPKGVAPFLVGLQFAMASILLISVIVLNQQNAYLQRIARESGDDPVVAITAVSPAKPAIETMRQILSTDPRIKAFGEMDHLPWSDFDNQEAYARSPDTAGLDHLATNTTVGFGYFDVFRMRLIAGRVYEPARDQGLVTGIQRGERPTGVQRDRPIVVDRAFTDAAGFPSPQAAVGQRLFVGQAGARLYGWQPTFEIIGVVETQPLQFMTASSQGGNTYSLDSVNPAGRIVVRISRDDVEGGLAAVRAAWERAAPGRPFAHAFSDDLFRENFAPFARIGRLFAVVSVLAFLISATGLFGMAVHVIQRRRHEIGVRKTLGSTTLGVIVLLVRDFSKPVIIANLLAWPVAYVAAQAYLAPFMRRIDLTPAPFLLSFLITLGLAWLVVSLQTLRAASLRPADVLRHA
jgi:putative ABC transport system permease protein